MPKPNLTTNSTIPVEIGRALRDLQGRVSELEGRPQTQAQLPQAASAAGAAGAASQTDKLAQLTGVAGLILVLPPPAHGNSPGQIRQFSVDTAGNVYFCYAPSKWGKLTTAGYVLVF